MAAVIREIRSVEKWNQEWDCLEEEIANIKKAQYQRLQKAMDEYRSAQEALKKGLDGQEKKLKAFAFAMRKIQSNERNTEKEQLVSMATKINNMTRDFGDLQQGLPKKPGWFLRACLGSINVSLSWDKLHYKNNYENFKLRMTWISMMLILFNLLVFKNRFFDAIFHAVLVWYYSSLTLQEHILIANGSKIKGWWVLHHYLSILLSGFLLIWPESTSYQLFRLQFYYFSLYLSFVQFLQYYYQSGVLYRLRALGISTTMDTTVEGFRWWMFRGLGFLLPFLVSGYLFQLYNAYTLFTLSQSSHCKEWQVIAVAFLFLVLGIGNMHTLILVIKQKAARTKTITLPCG
ncbi:ion channel TACAN-like [Rhopilema esculentum]|uniref:ion channel TACAN-like n=1 Tax=Rhopilema esculentum TaxID=499914 RepID=UPI0031D2B0A4